MRSNKSNFEDCLQYVIHAERGKTKTQRSLGGRKNVGSDISAAFLSLWKCFMCGLECPTE